MPNPPPFALQQIDHVVLRVRDVAAMQAFYCDVLGCTEERRQDAVGLLQLRAGSSLIDLVAVDAPLGRLAPFDCAQDRLRPFDPSTLRQAQDRPSSGQAELRTGRAQGGRNNAAPGGKGHNMDHLCLRVGPFDRDAIVAHLHAHDVRIGEFGVRYGAQGEGPSQYLFDPEGNLVELKGPADARPMALRPFDKLRTGQAQGGRNNASRETT